MRLRGEIGILGLAAYVWWWDENHEPITHVFWRHRGLAVFIWGWIFSHMVFKRPRKVLIWW